MNPPVMMAGVACVSIVLFLVKSSDAKRRLAARLLAWADAQDAYRQANSEALLKWRKQLGVKQRGELIILPEPLANQVKL